VLAAKLAATDPWSVAWALVGSAANEVGMAAAVEGEACPVFREVVAAEEVGLADVAVAAGMAIDPEVILETDQGKIEIVMVVVWADQPQSEVDLNKAVHMCCFHESFVFL
jgi:hypothetical protein